ncbi:hypothetical protein [Nakamurella endophytica]|uniref:Uncharacterized protein n=1 Tax=Nakamurella endophytica TaxID=1748367 RepID=A0A917WL76_9ACTN|nr:hypothetical protein [Nakamurella endophytica]GGM12317.1 hypothetical protein GCM10011594_35200 [Nakamurella endophytica]
MKWLGIALLALAGFLVGGVVSLWRADSRVGAVITGVFAAGAAVGGVLWLIE